MKGQHETKTHVVCEARGAKEDDDLELAFRRVCDGDNRTRKPYPFEIVINHKSANTQGFADCDLMARPIGLSVLRPEQGNQGICRSSRKTLQRSLAA